MLELEILGGSATAPTAHGAASSYLVHGRTGLILVDAGPGSLLAYCQAGHDLAELRAIVVTHLHADHSLDLMAWAYRWTFPQVRPRIPVYVPREEIDRLRRFDELFGIESLPTMNSPILQSWEIRGLARDGVTSLEADGLQFRSYAAHHSVPSAALRFESPDGGVVAFSSDTGYCRPVLEAAADADIFVCEATYLEADDDALVGHGHLTARMAGELASEASVRRLVLTHLSDPAMGAQALVDAAEVFRGPVQLSVAGETIRPSSVVERGGGAG
ncbi:MBL fold metallo-hydrolase [Sinomonas sp. ASV322]|uniref:MBL fold metallo-hydrolase n=1 Tax=Sinomonas sp. ASV322 TaxID=3041920 RepID=UPI0027DDCB12|nr:MBL fold metallo-hydrolase [Sinomonas sp. ASV322]MDQ4501042.1 MBL fold metallo-hydrolase [Sinomonas sp. ASV322]